MEKGITLLLAEKPSQAENYSKALGGMSGTFEGQPYIIRALRGHVMGYPKDPSKMVVKSREEFYGTWSLDNLPWNPDDFKWRKIPLPDGRKALDGLQAALGQVDTVTIATDVDPTGEGELLAWEALDWCGWRGPTWRMYHADESPKSVQKAFRERKRLPSMTEDGDWRKADCRTKWDYLSMQLSRAASLSVRDKGYMVLRQGRLKSVMVWLVGEQEDAYYSYTKVPYFEVRFRDGKGNVFAVKDSEDRFATADEVNIGSYHASAVTEDDIQLKRKQPPKPLDLAGISATLAAKGFGPKEILDTYQVMYTDHILSYPRTEDKTVTQEQFDELLPLIDQIAKVVGIDPKLLTHREPRKGFVKDGAAHGANRPGTTVPSSLDALRKYGKSAMAIYELVARSYLAALAEDYEYLQKKAHLADYPDFICMISVPQKLGYRAIFDDTDDEEKKDGPEAREFGQTAKPFVYEGCNKRPPRPTMKWLKKRLEKYDVGTGATRTSTIADITAKTGKSEPLMREQKGVLSLTNPGKVSHIILKDCMISSPNVTEKLHEAMEKVGKGELREDTVIASVTDVVNHDLERMQENAKHVPAGLFGEGRGAITKELACPKCGQPMRKAKSGKVWFCTSRKSHKEPDGSFVTDDEGCGYHLFTTLHGKKLTDRQVEALLSGKEVLISNLTSKKGTSYSAIFKADPESDFGISLVKFADGGSKGKAGRGRKRWCSFIETEGNL